MITRDNSEKKVDLRACNQPVDYMKRAQKSGNLAARTKGGFTRSQRGRSRSRRARMAWILHITKRLVKGF